MKHQIQFVDTAGLAYEPHFCPFCGVQTFDSDEDVRWRDGPTACPHLLFVSDSQFWHFVSDRFADSLQLDQKERRRLEDDPAEWAKVKVTIESCSVPYAICFTGECGGGVFYAAYAEAD